MDYTKVTSGETACEFFCVLELLRIILVLVAFFGQLLLLNVAVALQLIGVVVNLPVIFGWFFTSEFGKELKNHGDELASARDMYTLPPSVSFSHWQRQQQLLNSSGTSDYTDRSENQDTSEAMMYSAPSIAYCLNNLMR